jgi:hypothetical protein
LVCPYLTAAGNTAGIVVVTLTKMTEIGHSDPKLSGVISVVGVVSAKTEKA